MIRKLAVLAALVLLVVGCGKLPTYTYKITTKTDVVTATGCQYVVYSNCVTVYADSGASTCWRGKATICDVLRVETVE